MTRGVIGLIGHSGFVGGNLDADDRFDHRYNSSNIGEMAGKSFDLLVCAGVSAKKWIANADPDADRAAIARLTEPLSTVEAKRFVLISTIDVYPDSQAGVDEGYDCASAPNHAYGTNRLHLEAWAASRFPTTIVRLPALFGPGLRKNVIFDLLNDNMVDQINPASRFQWYPVARLWDDIGTVLDAGPGTYNLFPEPIATRTIVDRYFPGAPVGAARTPAPAYDLRTRYADLFGGVDGYMMSANAVLGALDDYIAEEREAGEAS